MIEEKQSVEEAAKALSSGLLVAFPTETVYGLGADASNPEALKRLYAAKGRPEKHPVIVHLQKGEDIEKWASSVPEAAYVLAKLFWPGPLTLVLKKARHVPEQVTGGQDTIAIRVPSHPLAQALLSAFGSGIAAPSANKFGRLSPTSAEDVRTEFGDEIAMVLDGGLSEIGIESTIVDLSSEQPRILRPGMIHSESIMVALKELGQDISAPAQEQPRVPGSLPQHYAPQTPLKVLPEKELFEEIKALEGEGKDVAVLSFKSAPMFHKQSAKTRFTGRRPHSGRRSTRRLGMGRHSRQT
jgi:L-threonylcarbamoyladenylate synthase